MAAKKKLPPSFLKNIKKKPVAASVKKAVPKKK